MRRSFTVMGIVFGGAICSAAIALVIYLFLVFVPGPGFENIDDAATKKEKTYEMIASPVALFVFLSGSIGSVVLGITATGRSQDKNEA